MTPAVFTREALIKALWHKFGATPPPRQMQFSATDIAGYITQHGLNEVIAGKHDGRAITFANAFALCYGERLTLSRDGGR